MKWDILDEDPPTRHWWPIILTAIAFACFATVAFGNWFNCQYPNPECKEMKGDAPSIDESLVLTEFSIGPTIRDFKNAPPHDDLIGAEYVSAYDGDTITVNIRSLPPIFGHHLGVRLTGLDTPEIAAAKCVKEKRLALLARDRIRFYLKTAKTINLKDARRDKYFRVNATVMFTDANGAVENLNALLLADGVARPYHGGTRKGWC